MIPPTPLDKTNHSLIIFWILSTVSVTISLSEKAINQLVEARRAMRPSHCPHSRSLLPMGEHRPHTAYSKLGIPSQRILLEQCRQQFLLECSGICCSPPCSWQPLRQSLPEYTLPGTLVDDKNLQPKEKQQPRAQLPQWSIPFCSFCLVSLLSPHTTT